MGGTGSDGGYRSAADCVAAGMYWFSQSDLSAAEAWWRRALELEPDNPRAKECLQLLQQSSSTGFKSDSWARLPAVSTPPREGGSQAPSPTPKPEDEVSREPARPESGDLTLPDSSDVFSDPGRPSSYDLPRFSVEEDPGPPPESDPVPSGVSELDTGPLDFEELEGTEDLESGSLDLDPSMFPGLEVAQSAEADPGSIDLYGEASGFVDPSRPSSTDPRHPISETSGASGLGRFLADASAQAPSEPRSPWDEGPSRTSVITVDSGDDFDAVADPTPLPELDRERFFNREDPSSREEIEEFLRATGDLPSSPPEDVELAPSPPIGLMSDDLGPIGVLQDAIATEPANAVRSGVVEPLQLARDKYQLHDFQGVLDALEDYIPSEGQQTEVRNMLAESRANLLRMYEAKIGSLDQIPTVRVTNEEVIWLNLNHRAGFILSQVDGTVSYEDLISLSGMPRLDTVRILTELLDQNVIGV